MPDIVDNYYTQVCGLIVENIKNNTDNAFSDYDFYDYAVSNTTMLQSLVEGKGAIRVVFDPRSPTLYTPSGSGDNKYLLNATMQIYVVIVKNNNLLDSNDIIEQNLYEYADRQIQSDLGRIERLFMRTRPSLFNHYEDQNGVVQWLIDDTSILTLGWTGEVENDLGQIRNGQILLSLTIVPV